MTIKRTNPVKYKTGKRVYFINVHDDGTTDIKYSNLYAMESEFTYYHTVLDLTLILLGHGHDRERIRRTIWRARADHGRWITI